MAVTMQQVAELAGVSRGTVDRVLHGRPNVNAVVREKVLRAAEKLGYRCKKAASAPRHRAAILIPQWTDTYFNRQVISGIRRALRYIADDSFELLEVPLRTMTSQELVGAIGQQVENGVDGLIVRAENTPEVYLAIRQALDKGIRVITYDGDIPDSGRVCFVGQDLMKAGAIAAGVMARLIRYSEHVLVVTGNMRMEAHKGRVDGFCSHLCELGFPSDAYHIIETNEMHSLTEELGRAGDLGGPSDPRGIYVHAAGFRLPSQDCAARASARVCMSFATTLPRPRSATSRRARWISLSASPSGRSPFAPLSPCISSLPAISPQRKPPIIPT